MNKTNEENDKLIYEIGYHVVPLADESEILTQVSSARSIIEGNGGVIISEELPKMTTLAYEIIKSVGAKKQRFNRAYFGWIKFEADPAIVGGIKKAISDDENILRFLIIKTVKENTMHIIKPPVFRKESNKEEKNEEHIEKPKATEAEIDKSIEELVINQTL